MTTEASKTYRGTNLKLHHEMCVLRLEQLLNCEKKKPLRNIFTSMTAQTWPSNYFTFTLTQSKHNIMPHISQTFISSDFLKVNNHSHGAA
jgi:hypothetical protein